MALFNPKVWLDLAGMPRNYKYMPGLLSYRKPFRVGNRHQAEILFDIGPNANTTSD